MKKHKGRIPVKKFNVLHFKTNVAKCCICGEGASHIVLGFTPSGSKSKNRMYYCTEHLTMIFRLPANRHPKKIKEIVPAEVMPYPGYKHWALRQHMDVPYRFSGERIACHSAKIGMWTWYFSLYWRDGGDANPIDYVLSLTRAVDKRRAIHMVFPTEGHDAVIEQLKFAFHSHGTIAPIDDAELLALTMEATKFIEECYPGKVPSEYRLACMEKLAEWRKRQDVIKAEAERELRTVEALAAVEA